jgi:periplasmic mercuric ion binding protein
MKNFTFAAAFVATLFCTTQANAQMIITESFKVSLDCSTDFCKKTLENALYTKGVKNADWDKETKTLTVTYDPKKIGIDDIHKRVDGIVAETATADNRQNGAAPKKN